MNLQELEYIGQTLLEILSNDNNLRQAAEAKLNVIKG